MKSARKDGLRTRQRILDAACEIFAEKGFRDATVAEICDRARANSAAVNYHFGSKEALYTAAWRDAFEAGLRLYPPDGGVPPSAPPETRLHARILSLLRRIFDDGRLGHAARFLLRELANPTDVLDRVHGEVVDPLRDQMHALLRELLGPDASETDVLHSQMSVVNQCLAIAFMKGQRRYFIGQKRLSSDEVEALAEHITRFSLAGITAIRSEREKSPEAGR